MLAVGLSHRIRIALVIIILTFVSLLTGSANASRQPRAMTESGVVLGRNIGGVNNFLGIPYAAPPVGPLRWQPPQPYGNFPGLMLDATAFGSECIQSGGGNEDCLFLNVYQPAN